MLVLGLSGRAVAQTSGLLVDVNKAESPKFGGFHFDLGIYDGSNLNSVGQNYSNALSFYFEPSWDIGRAFAGLRRGPLKNLTLVGRFVMSAGLSGTEDGYFSGNTTSSPQGTCSNTSISTNGGVLDPGSVQYCNPSSAHRRADYSDTWLTLRIPAVYKIPKALISISPALRFIFPSSAESRYQTLLVSITPSLGLSRTFWKGHIRLGFSFGVNKSFHKDATARYTGGSNGTTSTQGGNSYDGGAGSGLSNFYADPTRQATVGGLNTNFSLLSVISTGLQFSDKWSADLLYIVSNNYPYGQGCTQMTQGQDVNLCQSGSAVAGSSASETWRPGRRDYQTFWASLSYQPFEWIGFSVSWINSAPLWKPDSTYRQGFISTDYNAFTTLSFGTSISIDHIVSAVQGKKKASTQAKASTFTLQ
ncbi:MAG: hypothetical protein ABI321_09480 [Polyangia bacterium]